MLHFVESLTISPAFIVGVMMIIVVIMGSFMETASIVTITAPIFMSVIEYLGLDPVWFSALMVLNIEIGLSTPPFGTNLFVMKALAPEGTTMEDIYLSGLPFNALECAAMAVIIAFPPIALFLPSLMGK